MNLTDFLFELPDNTDEQTALFNCLSSYFFANGGCINSYGFTFICDQAILELKMNTFNLEN